MPVMTIERPRALCPAGPATFVLGDVTPKMMPSYDGLGEVERWGWRFVSDKRDPETGQFYEVMIFTGSSYGNSRAKSTWLLDLLMPNATREEKGRVDTDTLLGTHYEGMVKHEQAIRDPEKKVATFSYLKPLGNEGAPDPFAFDDGAVESCDVCGEELTDLEIKSSRKHWGDARSLCLAHGRIQVQADKAEQEDPDRVAAGALAAT